MRVDFSLRVCKLNSSIFAVDGVVNFCRGRSRLESTPRFEGHISCLVEGCLARIKIGMCDMGLFFGLDFLRLM